MDLTPENKKKIDGMSYEQLLHKWRLTPVDSDGMFTGETGAYFSQRMSKIKPKNHVEMSKRVGWQR